MKILYFLSLIISIVAAVATDEHNKDNDGGNKVSNLRAAKGSAAAQGTAIDLFDSELETDSNLSLSHVNKDLDVGKRNERNKKRIKRKKNTNRGNPCCMRYNDPDCLISGHVCKPECQWTKAWLQSCCAPENRGSKYFFGRVVESRKRHKELKSSASRNGNSMQERVLNL